MLPVNCGSHADYQNFVVENLRKYYPNPDSISHDTWDIIDRFWNLDLSYTDEMMRSKYSKYGPAPRTPSCMQRSYLLSIAFKVTSITEWAAQPVDKTTVEQLLETLENQSFSIDEQPYGSLFDLYTKEFLRKSLDKGVINNTHLSIAGDGTPVVTSARERKHRVCDCASKGIHDCGCKRYFSQPDCDVGWDSSRSCFYHGYDLYMLVASDSDSDLPVFPLLHPASMHDSHGFLHAFFRMKSFLPDFHVEKLLLDSAHDAMPYYLYCRRKGITPFIDLNEKRGIKEKYKDDFTIGKDGIPICKAGLKMNHDGTEISKARVKFRCPLASRKYGCSCKTPCSDSKYGRTVHLAMKDNPRLINIPPRDSALWKKEYNARTSAERSNKREKIDFKLEDGRHRSTKMWYCRLYHILMLQHLDAWDMPFESTLRKLICNAA